MALRDNPYLPLYVKDYLTDEKLSCCTLATQGVYIRILCVFHKSETYGGILYREIPDKNYSNIQFFSFIISKQIGVDFDSVFKAISELLFYNVLRIKKENGVDFLYQKRMIEDFELSEKRSKSGKKGMKKRYKICYNKNDNKTITNDITNAQQNPGSENGNGNNNNILLEGGMGETPKHCIEGEETFCEVLDELSFENVWQMYGKKGNKKTSQRKWDGLPKKAKLLAVVHIPRYVAATPDIQYRKHFETYINQEAWNDEIFKNNETNRGNNNNENGGLDEDLMRSIAAGIARGKANKANG